MHKRSSKRVVCGLLFVSFSAFGAASSQLAFPEGALPIEILQMGFADLGEKSRMGEISCAKDWREHRRACFNACEKALDKAIERKEHDQLMLVAQFWCDDLPNDFNGAYRIIEKCIVNYPGPNILFLLNPEGRSILEEAIKWNLCTFNVAGLETVCSRVSPKDFTSALQTFEPSYAYKCHLWWQIMHPKSFVDMESSNNPNVKQLFDVVKEMKERVCAWYRHVGLEETQLMLESLETVYAKIIDTFDKLSDEGKRFNPAVLLQVYQAGIENKEIAERNTAIILKALTLFQKIGIHPSNLFMLDKPEGESLFSAGLTYAKEYFMTPLDKLCSLLSPEEFDAEAERLQRLDTFRWWYGKHRDKLHFWRTDFVDQNPYFEKLNRAGHNALLQHQTLFTLLVPMLKEMHA